MVFNFLIRWRHELIFIIMSQMANPVLLRARAAGVQNGKTQRFLKISTCNFAHSSTSVFYMYSDILKIQKKSWKILERSFLLFVENTTI